MKLIYLSHPYTGDETENRRDAQKIAAALAKKYPGILFVNPLDAMRHLKVARLLYEDVMEQCKALLDKCDGLIMTGDWRFSTGCMEEYLYARQHHIVVWESPEEFRDEEVMNNDCCGKYPSCKSCACRICANRLQCWNCNDCTREGGHASPIGYTKKVLWDAECSSYTKKEG